MKPSGGKLLKGIMPDKAKREQQERLKAAQVRRNAGLAKSKVGDRPHTPSDAGEVDAFAAQQQEKPLTFFDKIKAHEKIGLPLRMVDDAIQRRRMEKQRRADDEARRVWDMLQALQPGCRVKLIGLSKVGGITYNGRLATVQASVGNRFSVKLDATERDGTIRKGQGMEIKVGPENMEIYDEDIEAMLDAEMELDAFNDDLNNSSPLGADTGATAVTEAPRAFKPTASAVSFKPTASAVSFKPTASAFSRRGSAARQGSMHSAVSSNAEEAIEVGGVPFSMLDEETPVEDLRAFHEVEGLKCTLFNRMFPDEMYAAIAEEWEQRLAASRKATQLLASAIALMKEGSDEPAPRNELRKFVLNPSFYQAKLTIREAKEVLAPLFERKVQSGAFCDVGEGTFTLEDKPVEKGGPSTEDDAYKGCNLRIVSGMAQGHFSRVTGYVGETRVCTLLEWYAALPDLSSRFEILGSEMQALHIKGVARGGTLRSIQLGDDADPGKNFYRGLSVRVTSGPAKSQVARITSYDGETRTAALDGWVYDKSLLEKALDQEDDDVPVKPPTAGSKYKITMPIPSGKMVKWPIKGRIRESTSSAVTFGQDFPDHMDLYTGKGLLITDGEGRGQTTMISIYDAASRQAKIEPWRPAVPDKTSKYSIVKMPGRDRDVLEIESDLFRREAWAKGKQAELERKRRMTIRAKMWAAVRLEMMSRKEGERVMEARQRESAAAWAAYDELAPKRSSSDENMVTVGGRLVKITWDSLLLDQMPVKKADIRQVLDEETGGMKEEKVEGQEDFDLFHWKGHNLVRPRYKDLQRELSGIVKQPVVIKSADTGRVFYSGPSYGWRLWKSLMNQGEPHPSNDNVFLWKGRTLLQPVCILSEEGVDTFLVVDDVSGELIYCGEDVEEPIEEEEEEVVEQSRETSLLMSMQKEKEDAQREQQDKGAQNLEKGMEALAALKVDSASKELEEIEQEEERAKQKAAEEAKSAKDAAIKRRKESIASMQSVEGGGGGALPVLEAADQQLLNIHMAGGAEWYGGIGDPLLWASLVADGKEDLGNPMRFRWRGLILNQPERTEDGLQKVTVVTDDGSEGEVIFLGENPNEKTDFPSEEEQLEKIRAEELSKLKLIKTTKELEFGQYSGTTVDGKNHGDGMMTWANGQVYSGRWIEGLADGPGTQIFPAYDTVEVDEGGDHLFPYFEGMMRDGQRHGKGIYVFPSGDRYQGEFKYGVPDGKGTLLFKDGDYITCKWVGGKPLSSKLKTLAGGEAAAAKKMGKTVSKSNAAGDKKHGKHHHHHHHHHAREGSHFETDHGHEKVYLDKAGGQKQSLRE